MAVPVAKYDKRREAARNSVSDARGVAQVFHFDGNLADRIIRGIGNRRNGLKRAKRDAPICIFSFSHNRLLRTTVVPE
jgi:hypothetical protein